MAFLTGYTKRKKITIDNTKVDAALSDFPVLVKLTNDADIGAVSNADGFDIRFTSSDGTTLLKYEREDFAIASDLATGNFWVKIPSVSSSADTEIYIYYRATDTADGADPTNVWDSNFKGVWHLKDITTSTINDSTAGAHHGTKKAANEPVEIAGKIGKAQDFDGTDDYINIPHHTDFNINATSTKTIEAWMKHEAFTDYGMIISKWVAAANVAGWQFNFEGQTANPNRIQWWARNTALTDWRRVEDTASFYSGTWYIGTVVINAGTITLYKNGEVIASTPIGTGLDVSNALDMQIGIRVSVVKMNGILDEIRLSDNARSAAWIKADYNSGNNSLLSLGSEEETTAETANAIFFGANF